MTRDTGVVGTEIRVVAKGVIGSLNALVGGFVTGVGRTGDAVRAIPGGAGARASRAFVV